MNKRGSTKRFPPGYSLRASFSLIEILVVLGLIAFLTAAIVVVLPRIANASKVTATRATIKKVDELLNDRMNGFKRYIQTQDALAGSGTPSYVIKWATNSQYPLNPALARVLAIKLEFRQNFPQMLSEMKSPPTYTVSAHNQNTESAACLYQILTQMAVYDTEQPSTTDLKGVEVADTDGDGLMEVVDAWGQPLRFYRWPTRLVRAASPATTGQSIGASQYAIQINPQWTVTFTGMTPNETTTVSAQSLISSITVPPASTLTLLQEQTTAIVKDLAKDPDDPSGLIQSAMTQTSPPPLFTPTAFETNFHTPDTYFTPLILSAGPNDTGPDAPLLGLYEPWDTTNFGYLAQPVLTNATNRSVETAVFGYITNHQ
jgi:type II secretory pathway pseudopilin PulG